MPYSSTEGKDWLAERYAQIAPASVLDVGAGSGTYASILRPLGPDAWWEAVEVHRPYVARFDLEAKYDRVYVGDIREFRFDTRYDLIIAGDVLEHMGQPEAVKLVRRFKQWGRHLFISVPIIDWPQGAMHDNPHEAHLHQWQAAEMTDLLSGAEHKLGAEVGVWHWRAVA